MAGYPSINWWPGNLRLYESRLSFLARFSALNGVSARRCLEYLNIYPDDDRPLAEDELRHLASALREGLPSVEDIFSPSVRFVDVGLYGPPPARRGQYTVRYCEKCAQHGYHSYLHETAWLSRCPFHMCELKEGWGPKHSGVIAMQRMAALEFLMRKNCAAWPHGPDCSLPDSERGCLASLVEWVKNARRAAEGMSRGEIWRSGEDGFLGHLCLDQAFGQLRTLEPIPTGIEPLFTDPGGRWSVEVQRFPMQARIELERLSSCHLSFARIFDFYIRISAPLANPPSFVARLKAFQDLLRSRHRECHCRWELVDGGWESYWVKVHPNEWAHRVFKCPFEVALEELELGWGRFDEILSNRKTEQERLRLFGVSREMHDAGLIHNLADASVSPEGYLYMIQGAWPCCEWNPDSPLVELLDTAATWEIEAAFHALRAWLDAIDEGVEPGERNDPKYTVRLREIDDGLSLLRWVPEDNGRARTHGPDRGHFQ